MTKGNPYPADTIPHLLYARAARAPRGIAYSFPELGQHGDWASVWHGARTLAKGYLRLGVRKGDRVAMLATGRLELILALYAAACIGAVAVPLNAYSKPDELRAYLQAAKPSVLLLGAEGHGLRYPSMLLGLMAGGPDEDRGWLPRCVFVFGDEADVPAPFSPFAALESLGRGASDDKLESAARMASPDDPVVLLFTSGTVGTPKAVLRTTASFLPAPGGGRRSAAGSAWIADATDRIARKFPMLSLLPLYHMGGYGTLFSNLKACDIRIVLLRQYSPAAALDALERERIRMLIGTPYMIQRILTSPQRARYDLSALLGVGFTSAAVDRAVIRDVVRELNLAFFLVSYGSSEAGAVANGICLMERKGNALLSLLFRGLTRLGLLGGTIPLDAFERNPYSLGGRVDRGLEVRVADPATGEPLPTGGHGEIWIRGHRVMRYAGAADGSQSHTADGSQSHTADGWYRSGDLGWVDAQGLLTVSGRLHRQISRGGEKIAPGDIEHALLAHPAVGETMVVGVPDPLYGEQICACVVPKPGAAVTEDDLRAFLAPRLSAFKIPQHFLLLPSLPMAATGKLAVADIRRLAIERLEREAAAGHA